MLYAIDPGSAQSGWVLFDPHLGRPTDHGIWANDELLAFLRNDHFRIDEVVIEWVAPRGMLSSAQLFETLWWAGRFTEAVDRVHPGIVHRLERAKVKQHICGSTRAKDGNIRQALIDRYGGIEGKAKAIGLKKSPGPLYGFAQDAWAALALAITYTETKEVRE